MSSNIWEKDAWYGDPADPNSIRIAVQKAWDEGAYGERSCNLKRILEKFNWEQTVDSTEKLYKNVYLAKAFNTIQLFDKQIAKNTDNWT